MAGRPGESFAGGGRPPLLKVCQRTNSRRVPAGGGPKRSSTTHVPRRGGFVSPWNSPAAYGNARWAATVRLFANRRKPGDPMDSREYDGREGRRTDQAGG